MTDYTVKPGDRIITTGPVTISVGAPPAPVPPIVYTFREEFSGPLDPNRWGPNYKPSGLPRSQFDPALATVSGGLLHLRAEKRAGLWYSSSIDTKVTAPGKGFAQKWGIFEARIKIPKGKGLWPAGPWGYDDATSQEIDGMEVPQSNTDLDHDSGALHCTVHWGPDPAKDGAPIRTGLDLSADFHVYGFEWRASIIRWFLDGAVVRTFQPTDLAQIPNVPLPVVLDLGVSGWAGAPDASTPNPSEMLIDWVRVRA